MILCMNKLKVDESDEYNVGTEEENESTSESENTSEFFYYSCIYISGVSGTGKTATINIVIHYLNANFNKEKSVTGI